jgi:hypothetical protein
MRELSAREQEIVSLLEQGASTKSDHANLVHYARNALSAFGAYQKGSGRAQLY